MSRVLQVILWCVFLFLVFMVGRSIQWHYERHEVRGAVVESLHVHVGDVPRDAR